MSSMLKWALRSVKWGNRENGTPSLNHTGWHPCLAEGVKSAKSSSRRTPGLAPVTPCCTVTPYFRNKLLKFGILSRFAKPQTNLPKYSRTAQTTPTARLLLDCYCLSSAASPQSPPAAGSAAVSSAFLEAFCLFFSYQSLSKSFFERNLGPST